MFMLIFFFLLINSLSVFTGPLPSSPSFTSDLDVKSKN